MKLELREVEYPNIASSEQDDTRICQVDIGMLDVPVSLANSIRRILLSKIPNIAFNQKDVRIIENVSSLHQQFITHRTSLLPIFRNQQFKILCKINKSKDRHEYVFDDDSLVPIFELNEHNTSGFTRKGYQDIMSNDFKVFKKEIVVVDRSIEGNLEKVDDGDGGATKETVSEEKEEIIELDINDFFKPDYYTNNYCHFYVLKSNADNAQKGQKLHLVAVPSVGTATTHACYSPVSCVAFEYDKDTLEAQEMIFHKIIEQENAERRSKELEELNENEIDLKRRSFDRLDSERVYKQNKDGECNSINLSIESIGVYSPLQAFMDSLHALEIELIDLLNGIKLLIIIQLN